MNRVNMTIVFIGYDGYSDLWYDCVRLYKKNWPDCPFRTIFVNNSKNFKDAGIEVLHAGDDAEWSNKVKVAIEEVDTPYICLLLEDFYLGDIVDTEKVMRTLQFINKENLRYYKLVNMNRAVRNHDKSYKGYRFLPVIPKSDEYGVSLQAAIWEKQYLIELLGEGNYNAWKFEFDRVKESQGKSDEPQDGCVFDDRNILHLQHGVIQGEFLPLTIRYFRKKGIHLNIKRNVMSLRKYCKLRMISKAKYTIPKQYRNAVKRIMEKLGMKFVSTVRDK